VESNKRIIEVNGVKLEVDLTTARRVDEFRVGSRVKVLVKQYEKYTSRAGVIVGFDNFKARPTIIVAYIDVDYNSAALKYAHINADTPDIEICAADPDDLPLQKHSVLQRMDREIEAEKAKVRDLEQSRDHFLRMFGTYFKLEEELDQATKEAEESAKE
jgi:hypothetical protein